MADTPKHYQNFYTRKLTAAEKRAGEVSIKLDPYRVCDVLNIGGGAREQIVPIAVAAFKARHYQA